jgi:ribose-phosphate pyrophosphokinase
MRCLTRAQVDLHCGQIQGFFHQTPVDNLFADQLFVAQVRQHKISPEVPLSLSSLSFCPPFHSVDDEDVQELVIVSPDAGGVARARRVADFLGAQGVVTILKRRVAANVVDSMQLVGDVSQKYCFIFDDIIDTGGTLVKAAELLKENGARQVYACATHGLFSGEAIERINRSQALERVYVTDSIPQSEHVARCPKLVVVSLVDMLASAIERLHNERSLSDLFGASAPAHT